MLNFKIFFKIFKVIFDRERCRDLDAINQMMRMPKELPSHSGTKNPRDFSDNFDCVFWCGDLNFRTALSREEVIEKLKNGESIVQYDQLNELRNRAKRIFRDYSEDPIEFPPSYKYNLGTTAFDTEKFRTPSYCDRILYKKQGSTEVTPIRYSSIPEVKSSDHKPVWGMWDVSIQPGTSDIPLSGGLFNREVYIEGLKSRYESADQTEHMDDDYGQDEICCVQ